MTLDHILDPDCDTASNYFLFNRSNILSLKIQKRVKTAASNIMLSDVILGLAKIPWLTDIWFVVIFILDNCCILT